MSVSLQQGLKRLVFILIVVLLSIYTLIWLLSPWVANHYLSRFADTQGLVLSDKTSIRYNPFRSRIEINELEFMQSNAKPALALSYMSIELHLHQLLFEEIYISDVTIKGLDVRAENIKQQLLVAGISPEKLSSDEASDNNTLDANSVNTSEVPEAFEFPYEIVMPTLVLKDSNINFYDDSGTHTLELTELTVHQFSATTQKQTFRLSINSALNKGPININIEGSLILGQGAFDIDLDLVNIDVEKFSHLLPKDIDSLSGLISYQGKQRLEIKDNHISMTVAQGMLSGQDIDVAKKEAHVFISKQILTLNNALVIIDKNTDSGQYNKPNIKADASLVVEELNVYNNEKRHMLAAIKALTLNDVQVFNDEHGVQKVTVGTFNITESFFSDDQENPLPALLEFTSLNIQNIDLSPQGIAVGDIALAGLVTHAELDQNKELVNLLELPILTEEQDSINETERLLNEERDNLESENKNEHKKSNSNAFSVKVNSFNLINEANIHLLDRSVKPAYNMNVVVQTLSAGPFDTANPEQESIITLVGHGNRYAKFSFTTKAKPFLSKPSYGIKGKLEELSLPELSSYIKQALGYEIESGQLDLDVDVNMLGTAVDGEVDVLLRGIELTAADDYEVASLNDQISVPFNIALGMLKDGNGNVEISLPITGDTRNPNFGISGLVTLLVKKATIMGAQDYLVTTFVPYANVVNIAVLAGKYVLKVRINDLPYEAENIELQSEQEEFLAQFAALLKDHQETQVKLCAIATVADINKKMGDDKITEDDIKRLREISLQRVSMFKEYMIEKENIKSSRLLLCTPQIDSSDGAVSRLSFKI